MGERSDVSVVLRSMHRAQQEYGRVKERAPATPWLAARALVPLPRCPGMFPKSVDAGLDAVRCLVVRC